MTKASLKMVVFMMEISFERINISTECRTLLEIVVCRGCGYSYLFS